MPGTAARASTTPDRTGRLLEVRDLVVVRGARPVLTIEQLDVREG
jgi:hypothetical protein